MTNRSFPAWIRRAVEKSKPSLPKDYHEEVIAKEKLPCIDLSKRDGRAFADALLNPPKPGKRLEKAAREYKNKTTGDAFTMTIQIDEYVARQILEAETICYEQGEEGFPEEFFVAIKDFFPELAAQYRYLPWENYGESQD